MLKRGDTHDVPHRRDHNHRSPHPTLLRSLPQREVHLLANIHCGEQALAIGGLTAGLTNLSDQVTWRAKHFGTWQDLTSEVTAIEPPTYFQVTMIKGIFRSMQTDHIFRTLPSGATEMQDLLRISAPLPILGPLAEVLFLRSYMLKLVRERNAVIKQLAESSDWQRYLPSQTAPASANKTEQRQPRP